MKKRRLYMVELEKSHPDSDIEKDQEFIIHFQKAILLSFLEKKTINQYQYDWCMRELNKARGTAHWT